MAKTSKKSGKSTKTSKPAKTAKAVKAPAVKPTAKHIAKKPVVAKPVAKKSTAKKPVAVKPIAKLTTKPTKPTPTVDLKAMAADVKDWLVEFFPSPKPLSDAAMQASVNAKLKSLPKIAATKNKSGTLPSVNEVTIQFVSRLTADEKNMLRKRFTA